MRYGLKHVSRRHNDALAQVKWDRLERLLADHYRAQGYDVDHVGTGGAGGRFDGGIDLKLRRGTEYVLVQVKHWNAFKVPHNDVHQLIGLMVNEGATSAILVTSGEFTKAAIEAGTRHGHVELVDGQELRELLDLPEAAEDDSEPALGGRIAWGVGEDLAHAALGRVGARGGRHRRGGRGRAGGGIGAMLGLGLFKLAASIVLFLILLLFIRSVLTSAVTGVTQSLQATPAAGEQAAPARPATTRPAPGPAPVARIRACRELVDAASGTYIDHCTRRPPPGTPADHAPPAPGEKAKRAMEILSASTPEM